jgi:hypothetical protein
MWPRRLRLWSKTVQTRELKEPGEFTCSQCGFYIGFYYDAPGGVTVEVSTMTIAEPA